jgi:hypothetical protein
MAPDKFCSILRDFVLDLTGTFPELLEKPYLTELVQKPIEDVQPQYDIVFQHIISTLPPVSLDVLNQNESLFSKPFFFLPDVDFSALWNDRITSTTKGIIWKYLKLILISTMEHMNKDIADLLNEDKLKQMIDEMSKSTNKEDISEKFKGLIDGKIGSLAKEIAAETVGENPDEETIRNLMSSPSSITDLMGTVGDKITTKINSGELKESELLEEATQMLGKLKDMPGMSQFEAMFSKLGKINVNAMQAKMGQDIKKAKTKERLREKLEKRKGQK